jgi:hypothetical protein
LFPKIQYIPRKHNKAQVVSTGGKAIPFFPMMGKHEILPKKIPIKLGIYSIPDDIFQLDEYHHVNDIPAN